MPIRCDLCNADIADSQLGVREVKFRIESNPPGTSRNPVYLPYPDRGVTATYSVCIPCQERLCGVNIRHWQSRLYGLMEEALAKGGQHADKYG